MWDREGRLASIVKRSTSDIIVFFCLVCEKREGKRRKGGGEKGEKKGREETKGKERMKVGEGLWLDDGPVEDGHRQGKDVAAWEESGVLGVVKWYGLKSS